MNTRGTTKTPLQGARIALGVSGGIAAYKAPLIIRLLKKQGADVRVLATSNALQFTTRVTLETLSENPVEAELFPSGQRAGTHHIDTAQWADLFLLAPATANLIGKISSGISDDTLTTTLCAFSGPVALAPSMNTNMYENPVTKKNLSYLRSIGFTIIEPDTGEMACHTYGVGRMAEPERIVTEIVEFFRQRSEKKTTHTNKVDSQQPLAGQRVVVTAGPCREPLDPVRYISNYSSGKMGYALAQVARDLGADVTLVSGPTGLNPPDGVAFVTVETTKEMQSATLAAIKGADMLLMAAAPVDYAPAHIDRSKIKKNTENLEIALRATPDILRSVAEVKDSALTVVGFALESDALIENARKKLARKDLDMIVANPAGVSDAGPDSDTNRATIITRDGQIEETALMSKAELAHLILERVVLLRNNLKATGKDA